MRVLLVHNHYGSAAPSGENRVFEMERDMLLRNGHEVQTLEAHSDDIRDRGRAGLAIGAISTPWNAFAAHRMEKKVASFRPHVVHAHNTFPLLSPAIFSAARPAARVLTLHNYRLQCAAAIPIRNGEPCTLCIDSHSARPALLHGCYRGSRTATAPLALKIMLHRALGTWDHEIECFIALSEFQKRLMTKGGLPLAKVEVKPNFYRGSSKVISFENRPKQIIFVGRISYEKGVASLIEAWKLWGPDAPDLKIIGDGPLRSELEAISSNMSNVHFTGSLGVKATMKEISQSRLLLMPSLCFEAFGLTIVEAFAHGVAIGVSRIGPLPELAAQADGLVFTSGDAANIYQSVSSLWAQQDRLRDIGHKGFKLFQRKYTESANYERLLTIYKNAIERRQNARI